MNTQRILTSVKEMLEVITDNHVDTQTRSEWLEDGYFSMLKVLVPLPNDMGLVITIGGDTIEELGYEDCNTASTHVFLSYADAIEHYENMGL